MILDVMLVLGLLLSTASQLRSTSAAIGPGEIFLVVWVVLMLFREAGRLGAPLTPALSRLLIFWLLFACALSVGTLAGYAIGDVHDPNLFFHDVMAYPLLAAVSCLSVAGPNARPRLHRVAWLLAGLGSVSLALQLASSWGLLGIAPIDPWYWDRFRGWSANPLQLALLCAVLSLLALYLADSATRTGERIVAVACAILPIYVGRLTKSDTFTLVLLIASPLFVVLKLREWLLSFEPKLTFRPAFAWILILGLPLVPISVIPLGSLIAVQAEDLAKGISKDSKTSQQEAELRFQSSRDGISRGLESGMLGLGPGPHLEIPASLVAARRYEILPKYVETPPLNGMPNFEAHNTAVDLFTQGGLMAVLAFVWISATAFFGTYKARIAGLTTLLCGVTIFGLGNLIVRHPLFWFTIAICLVSGTGTPTAPSVRNRS
jgi:O-antigen ligase